VRLQLSGVAGSVTFVNAHSNTNITPGSPRALRVALGARF
jgi:hypothetical protein